MIDNQGENLRQALKARRIKQETFAKLMGVTRGYVHQMFSKRNFKPDVLKKICTVLDIESTVITQQVEGELKSYGCEKFELEIVRLQKEVKILEKVIELKEKLEPAEGVIERLNRLEYSMKYVLKFISNEQEYKKSLKYINVPLNDMSICISNAEGKLEYVNDEFTSQTGYTMDEVLGKKPGDILQGKKSEKKVVSSIAEAIKNKKRFEGEIINYNKMGDEITCKLIIAPMLDKDGQIEKLISLAIFIK